MSGLLVSLDEIDRVQIVCDRIVADIFRTVDFVDDAFDLSGGAVADQTNFVTVSQVFEEVQEERDPFLVRVERIVRRSPQFLTLVIPPLRALEHVVHQGSIVILFAIARLGMTHDEADVTLPFRVA